MDKIFQYIFFVLSLIYGGFWLSSFFVAYYAPDRLALLGLAVGFAALAETQSIRRKMKGG